MSVESSNTFANKTSAVPVPARRFIMTIHRLLNLHPFYLDNIEVYRRENNHLVFLDREVIDRLVSVGGHPNSHGLMGSRQSWDNLEVVIPNVEKSSPTDSNSEIHKAYHLAVVVSGNIPRMTMELPAHLGVIDSSMNFKDKRYTLLHKMPDYYMHSVQVLDSPFKKVFSNYSNTIIVLTYLTTTASVSVNSKQNLCKDTVEYELELTPGIKKTGPSTPAGEASYQGKVLLWNCRGAENESFAKNFITLVTKHKPYMTVLTDTRVGGRDARNIIENLPFTGSYQINSIEGNGGIWFLHKDWKIKVRNVENTETSIKVSLQNIHEDSQDSG